MKSPLYNSIETQHGMSLYFYHLPSDILEELLYCLPMKEIYYGLCEDGWLYLPISEKFRKKANKKFWTGLYRRDVNSSAPDAEKSDYEHAVECIKRKQTSFSNN